MEKKKIPLGDGQSLHVSPAKENVCDIHDWPTEGLAKRLVQAMRDSHPTGINACRDCLARAREDAKR